MKAFYAYPSSVADVTHVIDAAKHLLSDTRRDLDLHLWEENDISGRPLTDPIFEGIASADILVADITAMNFNVTFEIGYAIGLGKRVHLTRDGNITRDYALANKIGIFDTLGFETYTDERNLSELIKTYRSDVGIPLRPQVNPKSPVYVLQTPQSNWAMIAITARIKKARLGISAYR
ncbi:MAG: hypothetical protein HQ559_17505 [Lentisphaerae bacterium]|nr:hypothetical protein [Lentisphaerota bacterium]